MEDFYESNESNKDIKEETYVVTGKENENDIPVRWKEATTQMLRHHLYCCLVK